MRAACQLASTAAHCLWFAAGAGSGAGGGSSSGGGGGGGPPSAQPAASDGSKPPGAPTADEWVHRYRAAEAFVLAAWFAMRAAMDYKPRQQR